LTLLEILLSLAIFFGAMAALSQLAWNGARAAVQARLKSQAIIRCEAKLAEVLSGIESMQAKTNVPFPDNPHWTYSVLIGPTNLPELIQVEVIVAHSGNNRLGHVTFSLNRWTREPITFINAAQQQKPGTSN
jgi:hypothetical protein